MDLSPLIFLQTSFAIIIISLFLYLSFFNKTTTNPPPEATGAWPIIGHYKVFTDSSHLLHETLASMADRFGPIFTVRLGIRKVLVVSNWEITKEIFTTHDMIASDRPNYIAAKLLTRNGASFTFTPYGPYWRGIRKIISHEFLSNTQLEKLKHVIVIELENSIKYLYQLWREKRDKEGRVLVEMKKWFGDLNMNIMLQFIAGKRYTGGDRDDDEEMMKSAEVIREWFQYLGRFFMADALPFLDLLDLGGHKKNMKRVARQLDSMVGKWLEEHRQKATSGVAKEVNDFMDTMIQIVDEVELAGYSVDTVIKATCEALIAGGSDTTTVILTWTLSLLLNNRCILKKAQEELDTQVRKNNIVNDSDIKNLAYLQAVVKETLRLYPAAPINTPRMLNQDCNIAGYQVAKGTWLFINTWKLHRDPKIWSDPCEFKPERFLTINHKALDMKGLDFEWIPFGVGRRHCPGISLASQMLHMVLATLLQNFDMSTPNDAPIDVSVIPGLTNAKKGPLKVLLSPRLHAKVDA